MPRNAKGPTPSQSLFIRELYRKWSYFSKNRMLGVDGSFYYDDFRFSEENEVSEKTIMRNKRYWERKGFIRTEPGKHRGTATKYWVLKKPDKKSPFYKYIKGDTLSSKDDNVSQKGCQNVSPNNEITRELTNQENHILLPSSFYTDILKENNGDCLTTKSFFVEKGYTEHQIEEAIEKSKRN